MNQTGFIISVCKVELLEQKILLLLEGSKPKFVHFKELMQLVKYGCFFLKYSEYHDITSPAPLFFTIQREVVQFFLQLRTITSTRCLWIFLSSSFWDIKLFQPFSIHRKAFVSCVTIFFGFHKLFHDLCDEICSIQFTIQLCTEDEMDQVGYSFERRDWWVAWRRARNCTISPSSMLDDYLCYVWVDNLRSAWSGEKSIIGAEISFPQFSLSHGRSNAIGDYKVMSAIH